MPEGIADMAGFRTRALSAVALVLILGSALIVGKYYLWGLMLFCSLVGFYEFSGAMRTPEARADKRPHMVEIPGYIGIILLYVVILLWNTALYTLYVLMLLLISMMIIYVMKYPAYPTARMMQVYFGVVYTGVMLSFVYMTRMTEYGIRTVWLIFISSWICDTFAYLTGMAFGRHKLAPKLSPKKSVEGAIGGVAGSAIVGYVYGILIGLGEKAAIMAVISAVGAVISQFGDLTASAIKRDHDIKDYGSVIPGHGGILDRFDSVIITAPIVYMLSQTLI